MQAFMYLKEYYLKQNDINSMEKLLNFAEQSTDNRVYTYADEIRSSLELMEIMNGASNE